MGIDLYAFSEEYVKLTVSAPEDEDYEVWKARQLEYPTLGYVRESYHGVTHAVDIFCPETYLDDPSDVLDGVEVIDSIYFYIPSSILESRMPAVEEACRQRAEDYYRESNKENNHYSHRDTLKERDEYAASQIKAFREIVSAVKAAESLGKKVYLYNSY